MDYESSKNENITRSVLVLCDDSFTIGSVSNAQDVHPTEGRRAKPPNKEYSPYADDHFPINVYFGDTHLHTAWSADSGMGGATLGPDGAYRVSRGESVTANSGWKVKLVRPLDFLVVADHSEKPGYFRFH